MRIDLNNGMQNNVITSRVNQSLNHNNAAVKNGGQQDQKDSVSISPLGKAANLIESLMKEKQKITERKNDLIGKTIEKGGSMDSIKPQLESFDEQLKNIDEQISMTKVEQLKQQTESQKEIAYKKPQTEEDMQNERFHSIMNLSSSLSKVKKVSFAKTKVDGESKVLKMEIKLDESRRNGAPVSKKEHLAELQKQSAHLTTQINEGLIEVRKEIKDNNDNQLVKPENPETTYKKDSNLVDHLGDKVNNTDADEKRDESKE